MKKFLFVVAALSILFPSSMTHCDGEGRMALGLIVTAAAIFGGACIYQNYQKPSSASQDPDHSFQSQQQNIDNPNPSSPNSQSQDKGKPNVPKLEKPEDNKMAQPSVFGPQKPDQTKTETPGGALNTQKSTSKEPASAEQQKGATAKSANESSLWDVIRDRVREDETSKLGEQLLTDCFGDY